MRDSFDRLEETLDSAEQWLDRFLQRSVNAKDRQLAESLRQYVSHCRRDKKKWRSELAAERAMMKIDSVWYALLARGHWRG